MTRFLRVLDRHDSSGIELWFQLIKVGEEERPPDEVLEPRDYVEEKEMADGTKYFRSFPWGEV
eukprot:COSAG02_NODE_8814_length_2435_cov_1.459760_3_plen_63_part_00